MPDSYGASTRRQVVYRGERLPGLFERGDWPLTRRSRRDGSPHDDRSPAP